MNLTDEVVRRTEGLLELLKAQVEHRRSLAELRADVGDQLLEIQEGLVEAGIPWETWLREQQRLAHERGVEALSERTVRRYLQAARFRQRHSPEVAATYLMLEPSALREVATLPEEVLREYARDGVPLASGARVPLGDATTRQLAGAARASRTGGDPAPRPARAAEPPAPSPDEEFEAAVRHLARAGKLSADKVERLIEIIVDSVADRGSDVVEASHGDLTKLAAQIAATLEHLRPICEAAGGGATPELLARVRQALTLLLVALARWRRQSAG
jgi:hypothetical protein